jgi:hypothetical protein
MRGWADPSTPTTGGLLRRSAEFWHTTRVLLGVGGELLAEGQLDDGLFSTRAEQGRQAGDENGCVCDEDSNHRGILIARAREIESKPRALLLVASRTGDSALRTTDEY